MVQNRDSKKTLTKPKKLPKKSTKKLKIGGMSFSEYSPAAELANNAEGVAMAMVEALIEGDKEAFQEILEGYVKARQISKVVKEMKISRAVIYEAMDKKKNPSLSSLCKIMKAFKEADLKEDLAA
jgi:probable addiction module antidote protein